MDCFKYLGSQVAADGGCERDVVHRMNEGYRARGELKSVLSNRGLGIKAKKLETEVWLDGWCEGGFRQHRNDGGGCATMRERPEREESPGTCVIE